MSDIVSAFSPPYPYVLFDGRTITFKRMLSRQWSALVAQIRAEQEREQDIEINKQVGEKDHDQRTRSRIIAKQMIKEGTTIQKVIDYSTRDIDGTDRLLKFASAQCGLSEADWEGSETVLGVKDLIPPAQKLGIADEIAFLPIIPPKGQPDGNPTSDTVGSPLPQSPTGSESPASSSTPSTKILAT